MRSCDNNGSFLFSATTWICNYRLEMDLILVDGTITVPLVARVNVFHYDRESVQNNKMICSCIAL